MKTFFIIAVCVVFSMSNLEAQEIKPPVLVHKTDSVTLPNAISHSLLSEPHDSLGRNKRLHFGHEKGGAVCVNGLEKFEVAFTSHKSLSAIGQLHFYGPLQTEGRAFIMVEQEQEEHKKDRFFTTTVDLTWRSFPVHFGYTLGIDPESKNINRTFGGMSTNIYWSDIKQVNKMFHILRTGVSLLTITENLLDKHGDDSIETTPNVLEYFVFYQMQPIHLSPSTSIYSEGLLRLRETKSYSELELGIRNEKFLENMFGIGVKVAFDDFKFNHVAGVLRFNISNPNPKHR